MKKLVKIILAAALVLLFAGVFAGAASAVDMTAGTSVSVVEDARAGSLIAAAPPVPVNQALAAGESLKSSLILENKLPDKDQQMLAKLLKEHRMLVMEKHRLEREIEKTGDPDGKLSEQLHQIEIRKK
ncbi:MAG TPA: hypothetical protein O0X19_01525 [Methanocorpusculum sp.]|nr:hypothetical protein [Candidatus Methanocorpusculum equi]MCQ2358013.1 hypothetical protein [Methanocorpusculum sp.]HJJ33050.1 hypothetical protein [Methanocorpusculum sp.]HJJ45031.1 hypothetical protein [Methanocorpusculum sp.]HJJ59822.1 hypothetical protein [Methanocorpusculum sp.]